MLFPAWAILLAGAGAVWGWWMGLLPLVLFLAVGLGLPTLERAAEDLQAIRGFLRRKDPAVPELLEARRQLLEAFPDLAR